jgi:hypothetical protein
LEPHDWKSELKTDTGETDPFEVDPTHAISDVYNLDIHIIKKSGGSQLVVVIAFPIRSDAVSEKRLLRKIEVYLQFLNTDEYKELAGPPHPLHTEVIVKIHPDSDPEIFELLEKSKARVSSQNATLKVERLGSYERGSPLY